MIELRLHIRSTTPYSIGSTIWKTYIFTRGINTRALPKIRTKSREVRFSIRLLLMYQHRITNMQHGFEDLNSISRRWRPRKYEPNNTHVRYVIWSNSPDDVIIGTVCETQGNWGGGGGGILVYIRRMQWENKHSHSQKKLQKSSRPLIKYGKDISQTSREWVSKVFPSCFTVCDTDL